MSSLAEEQKKYHDLYNKGWYGRNNWGRGALEWIRANGYKSICDIGCGNGRFCVDATEFSDRVLGVDIASVRTQSVIGNPHVEYYDYPAQDMPGIKEDAVEVVTAFDVLEHIPEGEDLDKALSEMDRISSKAMVFTISDRLAKRGDSPPLHMTIHDEQWWVDKLSKYGKVSIIDAPLQTDGKMGISDVGRHYLYVDKSKRPRIIVYTAIIGPNDNLLQQFWKPDNVKYVCYTDREQLNPPPEWEIRKVQRVEKDPKRDVIRYKAMPHAFLEDHDYSIWIDANFQILPTGFQDIIDDMGDEHHVHMFRHPARDCTYEEAGANLYLKNDNYDVIQQQMAFYQQEGLKEHAGLPECNQIIRRNTPLVQKFGTIWYSETVRWSKRDQLSVMYAEMKSGVPFVINKMHARNAHYTAWLPEHPPAKRKPKVIVLCALKSPESQWVVSLDSLRAELAHKYDFVVRYKELAYLHKDYAHLIGGYDMYGPDHKPFMSMEDQYYPNDQECRDYDYLFFFENDMVVTPEQFEALMARNVDVVSGTYVQGDGETMIHHELPRHKNAYCHGTRDLPIGDGLLEVAHTGMGCLLIRRGVIERLSYPWFAPIKIFYNNQSSRFAWNGQDAALCDKIRMAGIKVWLDPQVRVGHIKQKTLYPGDNEIQYNAVLDDVLKVFEDNPIAKQKIERLRKAV